MYYAVLYILLLSIPALSQTRFSLTLSQSAAEDWKQGITKSLEMNSGFETRQRFQLDTFEITFNFKIAAGTLYEKNSKSDAFFLIDIPEMIRAINADCSYPLP